jgi:DNA-binding MarR family transcriptional regulator
LSYNNFMGSAATKKGGGKRDVGREAWGLLASLVYPPPFAAIARELDLRPAAFGTLRMLDRPRTMSEVAEALQCDNSNVTGIVDSLEEKGLVRRRPAEGDRRVKLIELTPEGRRVHGRLARAFAKPPEWVEALSEEDRRQLRDILQRAHEATG